MKVESKESNLELDLNPLNKSKQILQNPPNSPIENNYKPSSASNDSEKTKSLSLKSDMITTKIPVHEDQSTKDVKVLQNLEINSKTILSNLDNEAIRLSNDIFSFSERNYKDEIFEEQKPVKEQTVTDTPKTKAKYFHGHQKAHPEFINQTSLDHEAIKLSNNIFSENTKMSAEEMQITDDKIKEKQDLRRESLKEPTLHFKSNSKYLSGNGKTMTTQNLKGDVATPNKALKEPEVLKISRPSIPEQLEKGTKYIDLNPLSENHEENPHKNRPTCLGTSRFGYIDSSKQLLNKTPSNSILNQGQQKPVRNATFSDISLTEQFNPIAQSSSFAFDSKVPLSPQTQKKQLDSNFNVHPTPFNSGKYNVHFYEPDTKITSKPPSSASTSSNSETTSRLSRLSSATYSILQNKPSYKKSSNSDYRAKSEGSYLGSLEKPGRSLGQTDQPSILTQQIQATKDQHREQFAKALSYSREYKPVVINPKLPRPGHDYARFSTNEQGKMARRQERERTVIDRVLSDRVSRATSLDNRPYKL